MPPDSQLCDAAVLDKRQIAERLLALEQVEVQEGQNKAFILEAYRGALKTAPEPMDVQALRQPFSIADAPEGESCWAFSPNDRYDTYCWFSMERGGNQFLYYRDHSANIICESHLDEMSPQQKDFKGAFPISYAEGLAAAQQAVDALGLRDRHGLFLWGKGLRLSGLVYPEEYRLAVCVYQGEPGLAQLLYLRQRDLE